MIDIGSLEHSARTLLSDVVTNGDWTRSLESMMVDMNALGGGIARSIPPNLYAIPTSGMRDQFMDFRAGRAPPLTMRSVVTSNPADGFVADYMVISRETRERDSFFQEFLRPRDCGHEASAFLDDACIGSIRLLIFRTERQGRFEAEELSAFRATLPYLRSAALLSRSALKTAALRQAESFERRGEPVIHLGPDGRVLALNAAAEKASGRLFKVVDRRIATVMKTDQPKFERILRRALREDRPGAFGISSLSSPALTMMLVVPVLAQARDLFNAVSAIVVFIEAGRRAAPDVVPLRLLQEAAGLTARERDAIGLVGTGMSPKEAADALNIGYGTLRNYLKASFAKLGIHGQTELLALIQRLS